jgi:hypothetical protein
MDYQRPIRGVCAHCGHGFRVGPIGMLPKYCRPACRTLAYDKRRRETRPTVEQQHRALIWSVLKDAGLITADTPMPPRREAEQR